MANLYSIWIIGPSCCGKTEVAKEIIKILEKKNINIVHLDGFELRKLFKLNGYDPISRSINIKNYIRLVKLLTKKNVSTLVTTIHPFEKDREICRKEILNYKEVYLESSISKRIERDDKKLYLSAIRGSKKYVVDVDIPFDIPINPDFKINSDNLSPKEIALDIIKKFKNIFYQ